MPAQDQQPNNERQPHQKSSKPAALDKSEFFDASFTSDSAGTREESASVSSLSAAPKRGQTQIRKPAKQDTLPSVADRGLQKFCDGMDAGVWFARASMSALVTVAAGAGAYSLLMGGSYLYASACAVGAVAAGWASARMAKFAWLAIRGKGGGII